jgi:HK97 gp10 family phage protein
MPAILKSRIPVIAVALQPRVDAAVHAGAEVVSTRAKVRAPDAPPEGEGLVEAIHVEDAEEGSYVVAGNEDVFWGHFQEFGTTKHGPHPFLIPAAEESLDDVAALVTVSLRSL